MPSREYRSVLYEQYASVQKPEWSEPSAKQDAVWVRAALSRLRVWLPQNKQARCLDLGCGSGLLLEALRNAGYSDLRGVDLGAQAIDIAKGRGFQVVQTDLRDFLKESKDSFDLITAFDVVEHFGKDEVIDVLKLIYDRVAPGGSIILQTPNAMSPWAANYRYHDITHEWIFDPHCITSILRLVGFVDVQIREVAPYVHGFVSAMRRAIWTFIRAGCSLWNLAETGSAQGGVYTRNMVVTAGKPLDHKC